MTAVRAPRPHPLPVLLPGVPVLARADSGIHVGCDPRTAVVLRPGPDVDAQAVADLLVALRAPRVYRQVSRRVRSAGLNARTFGALLDRLVAAGKAVPGTDPAPLRVDVHGYGDLATALTDSLVAIGCDVRASAGAPRRAALFVLADEPVPDPALIKALMESGTPHLPVNLCDGIGVVGPLVLPGTTSCLRCVDLMRADLDPQWPALAARLSGIAGYASRAVARTTVAIACTQVEEITARLAGTRSQTPTLVGRTIEFRSAPPRLASVDAPVHPRCGCIAPTFAHL